MEQQFTYVKRFTGYDHLFLGAAGFYSDCAENERTSLLDISLNKSPETKGNFLALYCMEDER